MGFIDLFGNWRERRKHARHKVITTAWLRLGDGTVPHVCVLWDVSERGARLSLTDMDVVPTKFILLLERDAPSGTSCRIVWRSRDHIGLEFIGHADPGLHDLIRRKSAPVTQ